MMEINLEKPISFGASLCSICLSAFSDITIPRCSHQLCKPCLINYIQSKISDGKAQVLPCPFTICTASLDSFFIQEYISEGPFQRYGNSQTFPSEIYYHYCPQKNCIGFDIRGSSREFTCNKCGHKFCHVCNSTWRGKSRRIPSHNPDFVRRFLSNNINFCPNCRLRIDKANVCCHMLSENWKDTWCWGCGLSNSQHGGINYLSVNNGFDIIWYWILLIFTAPVTLPFWAGFWVLGLIVYPDILKGDNYYLVRMIMKNPLIWLIIAFIISPVVIAVGFFLVTIALSIDLAVYLIPRKWGKFGFWYLLSLIYILLMTCVLLAIILALAAIVICFAPVIGIVLIVFRIYY